MENLDDYNMCCKNCSGVCMGQTGKNTKLELTNITDQFGKIFLTL